MFKWFRSLRWRLQIWHALILLGVVAGFGSILHWEVARSRWDEVDAELLAAARILEGSLRSVPRPILESMAQELGHTQRPLPPPQRVARNDGAGRRRPEPDRNRSLPPPPGDMSGRPGRPNPNNAPRSGELLWESLSTDKLQPSSPSPESPTTQDSPTASTAASQDWEAELVLPKSLPERLGRDNGPAYYMIWRRDGSLLRESAVPFDDYSRPLDIDLSPGRQMTRQVRGKYREVTVRGPQETLICVGRDVTEEFNRIQRLGLQLLLIGSAIMTGGLLGGWWLGKRAVVPIERMTSTARSIDATKLNQRVDVKNFDVELEELGTVLNNMLSRLEGSFEQQTQFTADASHELRTPLSVILSSTELALAKPRSAEEYREHLLKCQRSAERMRKLIESLLALARLDAASSTTAIEQGEVDLKSATEEAVGSLRSSAQQHGLQLSSSCESCSVRGDLRTLGQVVTNLVQNAILYNRPQGTVEVELKRVGDECVLTVRDTGIGVGEQDITHLFDRFFRVDPSRSRASGGSGLGLAICRKIVHLHGGTIEVSSRLDEGSCFTVRLPAVSQALDTLPQNSSSTGDPPQPPG